MGKKLRKPHHHQARSAAPSQRVRQDAYDFTRELNEAGGRKRRESRIETVEEEAILRADQRARGVNLSRDMLRNNSQFRGMSTQMRVNVVGEYGKLRFQSIDPWFAQAQRWFNGVWARHADFTDGSSFRECLQLAVSVLKTEGDFVCVFDDGQLSGGAGTGRLRFFEADQICDLDEAGFAPFAARGWTQRGGVLYNELGRIVGVVVTGLRGRSAVSADESFALTMDPDSADEPGWVLVRRKFRFAQGRGSAEALSSIQTVVDTHEMLGLELQTAKVAASRYALITEPEPEDDGLPGGFVDEDDDKPAGDGATSGDAADGTANGGDEEDDEPPPAEAAERYTGGNIDYRPAGTTIQFDPTSRPNSNLPGFLDYTTDVSGAAFGLAHCYARGRADTSYTAFRGDMAMTWMCFRDSQQFIEDAFSDWVARRVIGWAVATGRLDEPPKEWETLIAWQYPTMPAVDEGKEQGAIAQKFKNGLTTFRDQLGPAWRETLDQLAEELAYAKSKGIPLAAFETAAGAAAADNPKPNEE